MPFVPIHLSGLDRNNIKGGGVRVTRHTAIVLGGMREMIRDAGRIIRFDGPTCRTLDDMTEEEINEIEKQYGCPVTGGRYRFGG